MRTAAEGLRIHAEELRVIAAMQTSDVEYQKQLLELSDAYERMAKRSDLISESIKLGEWPVV